MERRVMVFDNLIVGHHLEYINHLYNIALKKQNHKFIFVVPKEFVNIKDKFNWNDSSNIEFDYLSSRELIKCNNVNLFIGAYYKSRLVKRKLKEHNCSSLFLIMIMQFLPFIAFMLNARVKISGIIYAVYLYKWKESNFIIKMFNIFKYLIIGRAKVFESVFVLNDNSSANYFNHLYKTSKFKNLPDPFIPIKNDGLLDIRNEYNISNEKKIYIHFGDLTERKGTLTILKSIEFLTKEEGKQNCFIFAGRISKDIKEEFSELLKRINLRVQILVFDEFCSYEFLGALCRASNYILIPYSNISQSSGVLGYAAQFGRPVVGPKQGLLGKLIRKNKLGYTLEKVDENYLSDFYKSNYTYKPNKSNYLIENNVESFTKCIIENFIE
ncbi:Glycosyltransferase involved in cell wall bisynthesis [Lutibacter oricola]|uniref:Glycosyltransferase involved in cell wall bisynthesis n=1 Tax=Lutibacter oricola TaxID=762486 RepID=A0A1H2TQ74_9FLAO|nr:glycosyltransferase [Lutibacter oricola]SDW45952.1 Glycosyltransferase involved in cell wall bisynthesis [Lutibacter oricola]